jgi:hypothetical protein
MLNGQQSQQIGNVRPGHGEDGQRKDPLFGQVYLLSDVDDAVTVRMRGPLAQQLNRNVLRALEEMIRSVNPFAQRLMTLGQSLAAATESGESASTQNFFLSILDNRPAPGQVCAFFESTGRDPPNPALSGIWIRTEGNRLKRIELWNRNADWLLFAVMFPRATQTYGRGIPRHSLRRIQDHPLSTCADAEFLDAVAETDDGDILLDAQPEETGTVDGAGAANDGAPVMIQPLQIPETEPANWNDELEVLDLEIPESAVRPAAEVVDLTAFQEPADFGEDRNVFANRILHATGACCESVDALLANASTHRQPVRSTPQSRPHHAAGLPRVCRIHHQVQHMVLLIQVQLQAGQQGDGCSIRAGS